ncbi:hypothetical protein KDA82_02085, partial [Streptomyces daliensis]|nr:hypothetical protein [Streptomyces daliensis]
MSCCETGTGRVRCQLCGCLIVLHELRPHYFTVDDEPWVFVMVRCRDAAACAGRSRTTEHWGLLQIAVPVREPAPGAPLFRCHLCDV